MNQTSEGDASAPAQTARIPEPVRFTGSGSEYFGIWIVNLLLTILTIGIYSAWAKVRRLQYFYRHTEVAGSGFDFHGTAEKILAGRAIALVMLVAYNYSIRVRSPWTLLIIAIIALVMPWLLRNSFRFRLYNTSWRGVRFHFRGSVARAYRVFLLNGFLSVITLYVLAPFAHQRIKAYQHDNSWFGQTQCSFHARVGQFYKLYLLLLAGIILFGGLVGVSGIGAALAQLSEARQNGGHANPAVIATAIAVLYGGVLLIGVFIGPIFHALITNLIWSNTRIGGHRIECNIAPLGLVWVSFSNFVLVVCTLGLFIPWAMVRSTKFQLESIRVVPDADQQDFTDADPEAVTAIGMETASAFDFDVSL